GNGKFRPAGVQSRCRLVWPSMTADIVASRVGRCYAVVMEPVTYFVRTTAKPGQAERVLELLLTNPRLRGIGGAKPTITGPNFQLRVENPDPTLLTSGGIIVDLRIWKKDVHAIVADQASLDAIV